MTLDWPMINNVVTLGAVGLLALDRFVHRLVGDAPLEARIGTLEKRMDKANSELSEKMSKMTIYLEERRGAHDELRAQVSMLQGEIHTIRGYRRTE